MDTPSPLLSPDHLAFLGQGVSVIAGACDQHLRPSVMRAVGCAVSPDGAEVTIFLVRQQSAQLLEDLAATGRIAVVFSQPSTHRTLQLKSSRLRTRALAESDRPVLQRYLEAMEHEIALVGHPPPFTRAMLAWRAPDVVAVSFVPEQAFDQTPGPRAGSVLAAAEPATPARPGPAPRARHPVMEAGAALGPPLGTIRPCLEGVIPAVMATCGRDGWPNVAYISQVYHVDEQHVALSFQFFNKTRANILANPLGSVLVLHPVTAHFYRLRLRYLRTESEGAVFEAMKAQLAGIASHSGMAGVFRLRGSDIYRVQGIEDVPGEPLPDLPPRCGLLGATRRCSERMARCTTLDELLQSTLAALAEFLGMRHAMVLLLDPRSGRLYTVASAGYATSGLGSEIELGDGVIGVAARACTPVRIQHMTTAYLYSRAVRSSLRADSPGLALDTDIPYPGLAAPHSQLAVPIQAAGRLLGVLFVESPNELHFGFEDEDLLVALAGQLGAAIELLRASAAEEEDAPEATADALPTGQLLQVRRYAVNDSVFLDDAYLIKGVAGAIFWKLASEYVQLGRREFSNRELRLDPRLGLPDVTDNLEARLLLLQRRLAEHASGVRIEKTGRGRFRLLVPRPIELIEVS